MILDQTTTTLSDVDWNDKLLEKNAIMKNLLAQRPVQS